MSTIQTNAIVDASGGNTATVNGHNITSSNMMGRNLIINGAMQVAQRGTSAAVAGFATVDRFKTSHGNYDELPTQSQHALTSSDTGVYEKGFRNSYHITNGNQTNGAGADDRVTIQYNIESQDLAKSGWDYTSSSSYITLSFWCKSSIAQNFYVRLQSQDGSQQGYVIETGSLTANTWTKVTKSIPGNSNLTINNDNGNGMLIEFVMFRGTNKTGTISLNSWGAWNTNVRVPNMTSTWYTTNDSTFELTGVQLEVGKTATDFEHRSYGEELAKCQRYTFIYEPMYYQAFPVFGAGSNTAKWFPTFPVRMRTKPTLITKDVSSTIQGFNYVTGSAIAFQSFTLSEGGDLASNVIVTFDNTNNGIANGVFGHWRWISTPTGSYVGFDAEL